jgi:hypothetical protein
MYVTVFSASLPAWKQASVTNFGWEAIIYQLDCMLPNTRISSFI